MNQNELKELTNDELLAEAKKNKSYKIYDALIIGFLIGIAIYGAVKNGLGLLIFLPLIYLPIANKNKVKNKAIEELLKDRNLK